VSLYDALLLIRPSPIVALNRAIVIAQQLGPERGISEVLAIRDGAACGVIHFTSRHWVSLGCGVARQNRPATIFVRLLRVYLPGSNHPGQYVLVSYPPI
jgi:hypothetical protein